jgi:hypothetical protein
MEGLQLSIPYRMMLVRITLVCALIISVLLSLPLWCGERLFPHTPVFAQNLLERPLEIIILCLMVLCFLGSMFFNYQRLLILTGLLAATFLILNDVNRLQTWFYIYGSMLAVFVFYNGRVDDANRYTTFFIILQVMFASVYFFAGFNQLNCLFVDTEYASIISPVRSFLSERQFLFFKKMGVIVPYILMFTGVGFIISAIRYLSITLAIIIHTLLLIFLFPSINQDYALWFSNLVFMIILILLFSGKTKQRYFSPAFLFQKPLFFIVIILFVIMPFFNNSDKWPDNVSFNIRSGNYTRARISVSEKILNKLTVSHRIYFTKQDDKYILNYREWCMNELKGECVNTGLVFNSILRSLEAFADVNVKEIELSVKPKEPLLCKQ